MDTKDSGLTADQVRERGLIIDEDGDVYDADADTDAALLTERADGD